MSCKYNQGELFVYTNGDRWELGMVKRPGSGDGYFCWYSRGDTAAFTPTSCMHKLSNAGFTHIEQMLDDATVGESNKDECFLMYDGKKYPAILDFGFLGLMPITITVGGFRYLVELPNENEEQLAYDG